MKILVYQTAFLGDLILTTPLIESIKNLFPNSHLAIITKSFGKDVLKNNPYVDELIIFEKKKDSTIELIKKIRKRFDIAISPHRSHRSSYVLFLAGIKKRIGFDKYGFSFLHTDTVQHRFDGTHEIERNLKLLEKLPNFDEKKLAKDPKLFLDKEEDKYIEKYNLTSKNYIVIAPGSKWATKRWTAKGFATVIDYLISNKEDIVLLGGKEDEEFVHKILDSTKHKPLNLVGKTSLRESFALVKHSKLLISNDSAPVHMAVSFNIPIIDIYGPTVKDFGFYPYKNGIIIEVEGLKCRPCGLHGHNKCPIGTHECMESIDPKTVIENIGKILNQK